MYGYIYITTNLTNGKKYIGKHMSSEFDIKYLGSGTILLKAIKDDGKENFECHILESINNIPTICNSEDELNKSEEYYIDYYNCVEDRNFYNLKPGGLGKSESGLTYITRGSEHKKVREDELEYWLSQGFYIGGPIPSEETVKKRADSNRGKKYKHSQTYIDNGGSKLKGRSKSDEHREHLRGKKEKPSEKRGKIVIHNSNDLSEKNKYIFPEEVEYYESLGYVRGQRPIDYTKEAPTSLRVTNGIEVLRIRFEGIDNFLEAHPDFYLSKSSKKIYDLVNSRLKPSELLENL